MSVVYTEITLKNGVDEGNVIAGLAPDHGIRQMTINALVDTGAWTLVINEATRQKLGLNIFKTGSGTLADGTETNYSMAGPVTVCWKDRSTNCDAIVLPEADDILLGAIPLEAMDLMVHPKKEEVVGVHGEKSLLPIKHFPITREVRVGSW